MEWLNLTLPTPAENIALDEALLDMAEGGTSPREILRVWESSCPIAVAGRSTRVAQEINQAECERRQIPIIRRSSGGATIVTGPGCLMYALVLSYEARPELRDIGRAHRFVLDTILESLRPLVSRSGNVERSGTSDLTLLDNSPAAVPRKFSGNSLRAKRRHFLYHGTLLYDFELALVGSCLLTAPRQPEYRHHRQHLEFVTNLPVDRQQLIDAVKDAWPTAGDCPAPLERVRDLVETRFGQRSWNLDFAQPRTTTN